MTVPKHHSKFRFKYGLVPDIQNQCVFLDLAVE